MSEEQHNLEYEYRKHRYSTYSSEREALRKDSLEISGRYDRAILALSGGALALSVTFIEKIAPNPAPWTFALLALAWLALIVSLLLELFALATSQTVTNEQMEQLSEEYRVFVKSLPESESIELPPAPRQPESPETVENLRRRTRSFNRWSLWLLTAGIALLCAFSIFNLPYREPQSDHERQETSEAGTQASERVEGQLPRAIEHSSASPASEAKAGVD